MDDSDTSEEMTEMFSYDEPDGALAVLADLANRGIEMSVTVTVRGLVLSGVAISGRKFFERVKSDLHEFARDSPEEATALDVIWDKMAGQYPAAGDPKVEEDDRVIAFLHLADVRVGADDYRMRQWRGRLVDVSGWSIGHFGAD